MATSAQELARAQAKLNTLNDAYQAINDAVAAHERIKKEQGVLSNAASRAYRTVDRTRRAYARLGGNTEHQKVRNSIPKLKKQVDDAKKRK